MKTSINKGREGLFVCLLFFFIFFLPISTIDALMYIFFNVNLFLEKIYKRPYVYILIFLDNISEY